jgi:hypothetical protein
LRLWGGDAPDQTRLYAGNPEYPALLTLPVSDNASGADNQQERPRRSRPRNPQRPYAELLVNHGQDEDMVHPMWRHVDQVNYNGPKVRKSRAHAVSNGSARIRLYAGKSGGSGGTRNMSDNPTGADNQQESLSPAWVVGFVDGEGCFFVGINRQPSMRVGWQVPSRVPRGAAREGCRHSRAASRVLRVRSGHQESR